MRDGRQPIVVAGAIARRCGVGGHAWALLQWILGLRALGYRAVFVDRLEAGAATDEYGTPVRVAASMQWRWLQETLDAHGLRGDYALLTDDECAGIDRGALCALVAASPCVVNVMGYLRDEDLLAAASRRVFLDIDPGFSQMWCALGLHDGFAGHDAFVTVGSRIGTETCRVPTCGYDWITTLPPVALSWWPAQEPGENGRVTSVATWRGPDGPVQYGGVTYGTRVHEFRRYFDVPRRAGGDFEIALAIDPAERDDLAALAAGGWRLADPGRVAADPASYRDYVRGSAMEFGVAKSMYTRGASGWFSDRTACYLASSRPAVVQDTGLAEVVPTGQGLVTFDDPEGALEAIAEVRADYPVHAKAARAIAEDHLDARRVIAHVLDALALR